MRQARQIRATALVFGALLLSVWVVAKPHASAQGYDGGGTGTSTLSFSPQSLTVQPGRSASAKVTVTLASGKTWGTNLQATDVPAGVTVSFAPASGEPTFTSTMTVKAASDARPGEYTVKVQATGDDPSAPVQYRVTVEKAPSGY